MWFVTISLEFILPPGKIFSSADRSVSGLCSATKRRSLTAKLIARSGGAERVLRVFHAPDLNRLTEICRSSHITLTEFSKYPFQKCWEVILFNFLLFSTVWRQHLAVNYITLLSPWIEWHLHWFPQGDACRRRIKVIDADFLLASSSYVACDNVQEFESTAVTFAYLFGLA